MFVCPIDGCEKQHYSSQVMCREHWLLVPKPLQRNIWRLYRSVCASEEHQAAKQEAIDAVNRLVAV